MHVVDLKSRENDRELLTDHFSRQRMTKEEILKLKVWESLKRPQCE
jgi:hypothetical protein